MQIINKNKFLRHGFVKRREKKEINVLSDKKKQPTSHDIYIYIKENK